MEKHILQFGKSMISYTLRFSERKTLRVEVDPNNAVSVIAPLATSMTQIDEKLRKKAPWILRQQDYFLSFQPITPPRKYVNGETHLYLGRQYRLKLSSPNEINVKLKGGYFEIASDIGREKHKIAEAMKAWYQNRADQIIQDIFIELKQKTQWVPKETFLKQKWLSDKWGRCNQNGEITLNYELIKAPKACIEYVVLHEFCHLEHLNHSKAFYTKLEEEMPNWKAVKYRLEKTLV